MRRLWILAAMALLGITACRVQVDEGRNSGEKSVKVDTPMGGVHVNTDKLIAADVGLPIYPGAEPVQDSKGEKSADVHMGFGDWQLRVKVVSYQSTDPQEKIQAFYKKALGRFGDVITCEGGQALGAPEVTGQGLACSEDSGGKHVHVNGSSGDMELKAGSKRHQHIVGFKPKDKGTEFALIELTLPSTSGGGESQ